MKLIVGLGNPGKQYELTRHNIGFMIINFLSHNLNAPLTHSKFNGQFVKTSYQGEDIILLTPLTYMNLSGSCVLSFMNYFKIKTEDVLIIHDEVDLPFGKIQYKQSGSHAGHNGLKDIFNKGQGNNFARLRIGVDKHPKIKTADWVLANFTYNELLRINNNQQLFFESVLTWVTSDFNLVMNKYNNQGF